MHQVGLRSVIGSWQRSFAREVHQSQSPGMRLEGDKRQCWCCVWCGGVSGPVSVRGPGPSGPTVSGATAGRSNTWRRCQTARPSPPPHTRCTPCPCYRHRCTASDDCCSTNSSTIDRSGAISVACKYLPPLVTTTRHPSPVLPAQFLSHQHRSLPPPPTSTFAALCLASCTVTHCVQSYCLVSARKYLSIQWPRT